MEPPSSVPRFHPRIGIVINPNIKGAFSCPSCRELTTNVSSVIPNARTSRSSVPVVRSSFWESERDISMYLILITNVVSATSKYPEPARIRFVPANWPALVRLVRDIITATQTGSPPETARNPNVNETGRYPIPMGIPLFSPSLYALFQLIFTFPALLILN